MNNIGLALSGGGVRALVFHLGVFKWLAERGLWKSLGVISSVSGGSLAIGAILSASGNKWPDAEEYLSTSMTLIRKNITGNSLKAHYLIRSVIQPWMIFRGRASIISKILSNTWNLKATFSELPGRPEIVINTTCYETGKNWRFSKQKMGDYFLGYRKSDAIKLSDAISASAAFPGLIGPLRLNLDKGEFELSPYYPVNIIEDIRCIRHVWLWDGGVYENLGIEYLYKSGKLQKNIDFLIVSDASAGLGIESRRWSWRIPFFLPSTRIAEIATDQIRALRARMIINFFQNNPRKGIYINIRNSVPHIFQAIGKRVPENWGKFQEDNVVDECYKNKTDIKKLSLNEFEKLLARGYEAAMATFEARYNNIAE